MKTLYNKLPKKELLSKELPEQDLFQAEESGNEELTIVVSNEKIEIESNKQVGTVDQLV
jgi:hypothetical protein